MRRTPELAQELCLRHHPAGMTDERLQNRVLLGREMDGAAVAHHQPTSEIDAQVSVLEASGGAGQPPALTQQAADPGQQLLHTEGLGDIVVRAAVESLHLLALRVAHREDDDRHLRPGAQFAEDRLPIGVRQPEVEHDEIG